jgi:hypothetical protein
MALNPVPQAAQSLGQTQNDILVNFSTIDTGFSVDHIAFNAPNQGFHQQVTLVPQATPMVVAPNLLFYSNNDAATAQNEIYIQRPVVGLTIPVTTVPMTEGSVTNGIGYSYLPSGVIVQWGNQSIPQNVPTAINLFKAYTSNTSYQTYVTFRTNFSNSVYTPGISAISTTAFSITPTLVTGAGGNVVATWITFGY